jgi:hypothetical protein
MRNTHKTIAESLLTLQEILEIADTSNKEVGLSSMGLAILMAICGVQRS